MTAISYLIPIVCGVVFLITIGMAFGGSYQAALVQGEFSIWDAMATMGGAGLDLLPVVISIFRIGSMITNGVMSTIILPRE